MPDHSKVDRADAQFRKLQRAEDGKRAMSEYEAERTAVRANTERLRALRIARDAKLEADAKATPPAPPPAKKKRTAKQVASVE